MAIHSRNTSEDQEPFARHDDVDLAAAHLSARAVQTKVLWICSVLGVSGLIILAVCVSSVPSQFAPHAVPSAHGQVESG